MFKKIDDLKIGDLIVPYQKTNLEYQKLVFEMNRDLCCFRERYPDDYVRLHIKVFQQVIYLGRCDDIFYMKIFVNSKIYQIPIFAYIMYERIGHI